MSILAAFIPSVSTACCSMSVIHRSVCMVEALPLIWHDTDENYRDNAALLCCCRQVCPAGDNCENQGFTKRLYAETEVVQTADRGWGLKANQPLKKVSIGTTDIVSLFEQLSCGSVTYMLGFMQSSLQKVQFMVSESDMKCVFLSLGWVCDRVCGRGDRRRRVPAADQTCPWKPHDQLLHAHSHKGNSAAPNHPSKERSVPSFLQLIPAQFCFIGSGHRRRAKGQLVAVYKPQLQPKLWNTEVDGKRRRTHRTLRPLWHRHR